MTSELEVSIQPKDGDVYRFSYSEASWQKAKSGLGHGDLHWCFDGQLVFRDGLLCDTYWGLNWRGDGGRYFKVAEAVSAGTLTLVCNLNDVEKIAEYDYPIYADGDAFNLSYQSGCYKHFVKRIAAKKDKQKMLDALQAKVVEARKAIDAASWQLECAVRRQVELTPRIEAGDEPSI